MIFLTRSRAAAEGALSDVDEAAFELIEPKGKGRPDVNVPARMAGEPSSDPVVLVGGVVVNDEVDVELGRHIGVNCGAGRRELLMAMAGVALGDDRRCCTVPLTMSTGLSKDISGAVERISQTLQRPAIGIAHGHRY
jgi:hypothetical protein